MLSNGRTAPIEILETEYPTRVRRFELIADSGGAGEFRGGLAPRREYEILTDDAQWTLRGGRHTVPALGADGGEPEGSFGQRRRVNPGAANEQLLPSRFSSVRLKTGDIVAIEKAGGGGFGEPRKRPFEKILDDVLDGYVSAEAARTEYGIDPERLSSACTAETSPTS